MYDDRLPVDDVLPELVGALHERGAAVLQAPPGAGKTTHVPLALLPEVEGRIVVLEPRRLAARAAARRMAYLLGESAGGTVGYTTRDERVVSRRTRIEVVTEGILVRRMQRDPSLDGVDAVLFDEFHERSLEADLGLALALEVRGALREDLWLVVMSATIEGARVADLLDGAPLMESHGRMHPVETVYVDRSLSERLEPAVAEVVLRALDETEGDVLVFLPGAGEIRRTERELGGRGGGQVDVAPLYGALPAAEQDRALDPPASGRRKVVLATDIAETSLTIEGIRTVVDAGLTRAPRFDPRTGMSRLETVRVSRASADQRRGRAGRVAPGVAYRLWAEREHAGLDPFAPPAIAQADLAGFALELAAWGEPDPSRLRLLDQPPEHTYRQSVELLRTLEVVDEAGRITEHGQTLVDLPLHPRLGHLVVRSSELGLGGLGVEIAALLADRDVLRTGRFESVVDLAARVRVLRGEPPPRGAQLRRGALARARKEAGRLRRMVDGGSGGGPERTGEVLALAYPDRVAQRREGTRGRFVLSNGRGASLWEDDVLAGEDLLVVADVDRGEREARIFLAAAIDEAALRRVLGDAIGTSRVVGWDDDRGDVVAEEREHLGAVVLGTRPVEVSPEEARAALLEGVRSRGLRILPWGRELQELRERVQFLHRVLGEPWPAVDDETLLAEVEDWLGPFLAGCRRRADLSRVPLQQALGTRVGWERMRRVDELAPDRLEVPSGSRVRVRYDEGDEPVLAVKLQEMFGATTTPRLAGGAVPVVVHLLSPAGRPLQVTRDLAGFWERGYPEVRAEMRGRYPKHPWPEDPLTAAPTKRTKRGVRGG